MQIQAGGQEVAAADPSAHNNAGSRAEHHGANHLTSKPGQKHASDTEHRNSTRREYLDPRHKLTILDTREEEGLEAGSVRCRQEIRG